MSTIRTLLLVLSSLLILTACQEQPVAKETIESSAKLKSLEIKHAQLFEIDYYTDYKKITIQNPWQASVYWEYYIYKKDMTPYNKGRQTHMSKASASAVLSSTQIGIFSELAIENQIKFIDQIQYVYNPKVRAAFENKSLSEIGEGDLLNVEKIILNQPVSIFTSGWEQVNPNYQKIIDQNIPVAYSLDWQEKTPLARAEWIKFVAAFYNLEEKATEIFEQIEKKYLELKALAQSSESKQSILHGASWSGTWYIAGGQSFMAQFYKDINANYLWSNDSSTASLPLSFEAVYLKAKDADVWFAPTQSASLAEFMNDDPRFLEFKAIKSGQVYSYMILKEGEQAKEFWETGIVNPQWVLEDLIAILHPDILPEHQLRYYVRLK